ncbi:unnamed protein product [Caenorhabditis auriculariae]|uniref:Uncharacterized protein n=1 Tax=Caenorhabditis auriculariae TaxID=2777116 RepID=A0A8S1HNH9_9PELO|nr:unnamed protein product [Caenorhabditis auriculariae]
MGARSWGSLIILLSIQIAWANGYAQAPGMYPPEEMDRKLPNVPPNPYGGGGGGGFHSYQFYYEKDPPKKENEGSDPNSAFKAPKLPSFRPGSRPEDPSEQPAQAGTDQDDGYDGKSSQAPGSSGKYEKSKITAPKKRPDDQNGYDGGYGESPDSNLYEENGKSSQSKEDGSSSKSSKSKKGDNPSKSTAPYADPHGALARSIDENIKKELVETMNKLFAAIPKDPGSSGTSTFAGLAHPTKPATFMTPEGGAPDLRVDPDLVSTDNNRNRVAPPQRKPLKNAGEFSPEDPETEHGQSNHQSPQKTTEDPSQNPHKITENLSTPARPEEHGKSEFEAPKKLETDLHPKIHQDPPEHDKSESEAPKIPQKSLRESPAHESTAILKAPRISAVEEHDLEHEKSHSEAPKEQADLPRKSDQLEDPQNLLKNTKNPSPSALSQEHSESQFEAPHKPPSTQSNTKLHENFSQKPPPDLHKSELGAPHNKLKITKRPLPPAESEESAEIVMNVQKIDDDDKINNPLGAPPPPQPPKFLASSLRVNSTATLKLNGAVSTQVAPPLHVSKNQWSHPDVDHGVEVEDRASEGAEPLTSLESEYDDVISESISQPSLPTHKTLDLKPQKQKSFTDFNANTHDGEMHGIPQNFDHTKFGKKARESSVFEENIAPDTTKVYQSSDKFGKNTLKSGKSCCSCCKKLGRQAATKVEPSAAVEESTDTEFFPSEGEHATYNGEAQPQVGQQQKQGESYASLNPQPYSPSQGQAQQPTFSQPQQFQPQQPVSYAQQPFQQFQQVGQAYSPVQQYVQPQQSCGCAPPPQQPCCPPPQPCCMR